MPTGETPGPGKNTETQAPTDGTTASVGDTAAPESSPRSRSYIARHWRGELSLPLSYWVNGVALTLAYTFVLQALLLAVPESKTYLPWSTLLLLVLVYGSIMVVVCWQLVGNWRSATSYRKRTGRSFWALAAKVAVVLNVLQFANVMVVRTLPALRESFLVAIGDPEMGPHTFRLLRNGTELAFSGGVTFGAAKEMKARLEAAPRVRTLRLDSIGGREQAAQQMRDLMRARGIDTYVAKKCLSACTVIYLGGRRRYLYREARLGFHAASFPGMTAAELRDSNLKLAAEAVALGVSPGFAHKAFLWPADSMWFPKTAELVAAGVVTDVVDNANDVP